MYLQYKELPQGTPALEIIEQIPLMGRMYTNMPYKPNYGYRKGEPLHIGKKENIINRARFLQFNSPIAIKYLVFDIDQKNSLFTYLDSNLPPPHIIIENLLNGHCHYVYELELPVLTSMNANLHPIRYFTNIQRQLTNEFDADTGFTHYICKNPFISDDKQRVLYGQFPAYTLDDLAKYVDLESVKKPRKLEEFGNAGRNCELFNTTRLWAYEQKAKAANLNQFHQDVQVFASEQNSILFRMPLPHNEVCHIAKSVSNWTWNFYDGKHPRKSLSESLAKLGKKGGKAKGRKNRNKRTQAKTLLNSGMNKTQIADKLGVSRRTINYWLSPK